jgi:ankyrin repeat protein
MTSSTAEQLRQAIEENNIDHLRRLLAADASAINALSGDGFDNRTPLARAAELGGVELVRVLLDHGANPSLVDVNGGTALWFASERGHAPVVALLKERGAVAAAADADDGADYAYAGLDFDG